MFFPFTDYKKIDYTYVNEDPQQFYTIPSKSMAVVEILNTGGVEHYSFEVYAIQSISGTPNFKTLLMKYEGDDDGGLYDYLPNNSSESTPAILEAGATVWLDRVSQYGTATVRLHVFGLPE